jgi:hypothetical protein
MASNPIKYDDPLGFVRPVQDGRTVTTFPFLQNGDVASCIYSRALLVRQPYYVPLAVGTERDNVWEGGDPNAYNMPDGAIEPVGIGDLVRFSRNYARIPQTQVTYPGSRYFPLPTVQNDFGVETSIPVTKYPVIAEVGTGAVNLAAGAIYTDYQRSLYGPIKTCGTKTPGFASGGTFTLTFGANTTAALNWNDSDATIAAAINGLASITAAGLTCSVSNALATVTGGDLIITWTVGTTLTPVTMNSSLTLSASNHPTTQISSLTQQDILMADNIAISGHGLNTALQLAVATVAADELFIYPTAYWGSVDANTIWTPSTGTTNPLAYVATFKMSYKTGTTLLLSTRVTSRFDLVGVTVASVTAIPVSIGLQNPDDFLYALANLTGWQDYETAGPAFWLNGPIYETAVTAINFDNITS